MSTTVKNHQLLDASDFTYQCGGALFHDDPSYVQREADHQLYDLLKAHQYCYVLNSRQMGKSSLKVRVLHRLQDEDGVNCLDLDMSRLVSKASSLEGWYHGIMQQIFQKFITPTLSGFTAWLNEHSFLDPPQQFAEFLERFILPNTTGPLVLFIDEIDSVLSLPFSSDDFFAIIRAFFNNRPSNPELQRLTIALLGVADPADLIADRNRTPFNIGHTIQLRGFDPNRDDVLPLAIGLKGNDLPAVIHEILDWTGGQPFLTHRLCHLVQGNVEFIQAGQEKLLIKSIVDLYIIQDWETNDEQRHLRTIRDRVEQSPKKSTAQLMSIYERILQGEAVKLDGSAAQTELRLTGLVVEKNNYLEIYNPIYREVFNLQWVKEILAKFRPYDNLLQGWLASGQTDESYLLAGAALKEAQTWAQQYGSVQDFKFITAGQEFEKQQLVAAEQAKVVKERTKNNQRLRLLTGILTVLVVFLGGVIRYALNKNLEITQTQINFLTEQGRRELNSNKTLQSLVYFSEAYKLSKSTPEEQLQLRFFLGQAMPFRKSLFTLKHQGQVNKVVFSPDGHKLLSASDDGTVKVWDANTSQLLLVVKNNKGGALSAVFSPDGHKVLSSYSDSTVKLWDANSGNLLLSLEKHQWGVNSVAFSPDGHKVLSASSDGTAKVWDANSGKLLLSLKGHGSSVRSAVFSPNGRKILTASWDNTAKIWDMSTGKSLLSLEGHRLSVNSAVFSPDGNKILTASSDNTAKVWDTNTGKLLLSLEGHQLSVNSAVFSPDGNKALTASLDNTARIWDTNTGKLLLSLEGHKGFVNSVAFSADAGKVLSASDDRTIKVWDALSGKLLFSLEEHQSKVLSAIFSPDGSKLLSASSDNTVKLWNVDSHPPFLSLEGHQSAITSAVFSPDGCKVLSVSNDSTMRVWDTNSGQLLLSLNNIKPAIFSPDGNKVLSVINDGTVEILSTNSGKLLLSLKKYNGIVSSAIFSPDGNKVLSVTNDGTAKVWNTENGQLLLSLDKYNDNIYSAVFSPDSRKILTTSWDKKLRVWNANSGELLLLLVGHQDYVRSAFFSPDGSKVLTASLDGTAKVWDAQTGQLLLSLDAHQGEVYSAVFSPDGRRALTASSDTTAKVWDAQTGQLLLSLDAHQGEVNSAVFSPDGRRALTASDDRTAKVWDAQTGQLLLSLDAHQGEVNSAVFSPDGRRALTASSDRTAKVWNLPLETRFPDEIDRIIQEKVPFKFQNGVVVPK
jgi:WD40 repeat protein